MLQSKTKIQSFCSHMEQSLIAKQQFVLQSSMLHNTPIQVAGVPFNHLYVCVCFPSVCVALCLSICFRFCELDIDALRACTCTHAHTNHLSPAQDPELLSLGFKVKEMQQVKWSVRGQRSLIPLLLLFFILHDGDDRDITLIRLRQGSSLLGSLSSHVSSDPCHFLLSHRK